VQCYGLFLKEGSRVDVIERFLGISPGGGDSSLEVMLLVVTFTLIGALGLYLSAIRKAKDDARQKTRDRYPRSF
jgi:hypothetical protein